MPRSSADVRVRHEGDAVTVSVHGALDRRAGDALLDSLRHELDRAPARVAVDLVAVNRWTPAGAGALRECKALATNLPDGLHYRTGAGAGHDALLAAYEDLPTPP